jgi:hypothetical protein
MIIICILAFVQKRKKTGAAAPVLEIECDLNYAVRSFLGRAVKPSKPKPTNSMA